ncbi:YXWGXW repeat-containing protein [Emticicia sp. TH156]|uniref:YXWGXW repeat-containing protein n=1 Tax=Emticicia sp. TH156 TaxID=2067454 RepID=UPI001304175E|nr:YXWGXW repeat-containing protein [Emticicia sp. TH156]
MNKYINKQSLMKILKELVLFGVLIPLALAGLSCSGEIITTPPPPAVVEVAPGPPTPGYVWIPGHYVARGGTYVWRNGYYRQAPRYRKVWVQGRYVQSPRGYVYKKGHWRR